jgi:tetratricopeptide (TPR) repeat protein
MNYINHVFKKYENNSLLFDKRYGISKILELLFEKYNLSELYTIRDSCVFLHKIKDYRLLGKFIIERIIGTIKPSSADSLHYYSHFLGEYFVLVGDFKSAIPHFLNALSISQNHLESLINLGVCYLKTNDFDNSVKCLDKAIQIDPKDQTIKNNRFLLFIQYGKSAFIKQEVEELLRVLKDDSELYNIQGLIHYTDHKYQDAITNFQKSYDIDNSNIRALTNLGLSYAQLNNKNKAIEVFDECLRINKDWIDALFNKAEVIGESNKHEAVKIYDHILENFDSDYEFVLDLLTSKQLRSPKVIVDVLVNKGLNLDELGSYDDSIKCLKDALNHCPDDDIIKYDLSIPYRNSKRFENAYETLISIDNSSHNRYLKEHGLGDLYSTEGFFDFKKSEKHYTMAIKLNRKFIPSFHNYALLLYNARKFSKALNFLDMLLLIDKNNLEALHFKGTIYIRLNNKRSAKKVYQRILQIDSTDQIAINNLKKFQNI